MKRIKKKGDESDEVLAHRKRKGFMTTMMWTFLGLMQKQWMIPTKILLGTMKGKAEAKMTGKIWGNGKFQWDEAEVTAALPPPRHLRDGFRTCEPTPISINTLSAIPPCSKSCSSR